MDVCVSCQLPLGVRLSLTDTHTLCVPVCYSIFVASYYAFLQIFHYIKEHTQKELHLLCFARNVSDSLLPYADSVVHLEQDWPEVFDGAVGGGRQQQQQQVFVAGRKVFLIMALMLATLSLSHIDS